MTNTATYRLKFPVYASSALAFASFGDAFLYSFLPLQHLALGIPLVWVGVILSVNRFVRIIGNHFMIGLFRYYGFRKMTILAAVFAIVSTLSYGVVSGVIVMIIFRIVWGLCFSVLRTSTVSYALEYNKKGMALGISKSIHELGPLAVLVSAPFIIDFFLMDQQFL